MIVVADLVLQRSDGEIVIAELSTDAEGKGIELWWCLVDCRERVFGDGGFGSKHNGAMPGLG
jgi:hypothetical protein